MPSQGSLFGEMGREKFAVELHTFQTFGLTALLQKLYAGLRRGVKDFVTLFLGQCVCDACGLLCVCLCDVLSRYVSDSKIITTGDPVAKILFFDIAGYRRHAVA